MRLYATTYEAVIDIGRELKKCSSNVHTQTYQNKSIADNPQYQTREIQAFSFAILKTADKHILPHLSLEWCEAEFLERIGIPEDKQTYETRLLVNPGKAYLLRKEVWEEFLVDGKFEYTYSERICQQIDPIILELEKHPETRQAVIEIHNNIKDLPHLGTKRIPCFIKDTKIETQFGYLNIQDLKVGDKVYTHTGKLRKITQIYERQYSGKLFEIRLDKNWERIYTTSEHPFLALKHNPCSRNRKEYLTPNDPKFKIEENWIKASSLKKNDYLVKIIPSKVKNIKYSKDLMRLFGYYLAEGDICFDKRHGRNKPSRVRFNMSTQDEELGYNKDIRKIMQSEFNLTKTHISKKRKNIRISFCNRQVAQLIYDLFGTGSFKKIIPIQILNAQVDYQKEMLIGFIRGDGHCHKETNSGMSCSTISPSIAMGMRRILDRLCISNSIAIKEPKESIIYGRKVKFHHKSFYLNFNSPELRLQTFAIKSLATSKVHKRKWTFNKDRNYNRIRAIKQLPFKGKVYNLAIEKDESYNLMQTTVHNCSLSYSFMLRDGALDMIYMMRSSDFITHFQNDIYLAIKLQEYIAASIMKPTGKFIMFVNSLHIYQKDFAQLTPY